MDVYIAGRAAGKTTMVIDWFAEDPEHSMIVVQTNEQKQDILYRIKNRWPDINLNSIRRNVVIAGDDIRMQIRGRLHPANRVAIDNLDQLLWMLFAAPVDFVTGTGTNVRPLPKEERYNG